jgi:hypothetical protein
LATLRTLCGTLRAAFADGLPTTHIKRLMSKFRFAYFPRITRHHSNTLIYLIFI